MSPEDVSHRVAEEAREKEWRGESFLRELFHGHVRLDLLESLALDGEPSPEAASFYERLEELLRDEVDPIAIDLTGEYPAHVLRGLKELGAFGMKIPKRYGGLGFSHAEYVRAIELVGSYDGNVVALLSAHQAIGVPQPIKLFGTDEQKERFLPRCARGAISAFALTEPAVGSDPARIETTAALAEDGEHYILDGHKLWCTNGTLAELIVVMARNPDTDRINAFVVEMDWPGVHVERRSHFMGLRALANAEIHFDGVRVPRDNRIGAEGEGLKIALTTLNTGRLTLPASTAGIAKHCAEIVRKWSNARVQWGAAIGVHEAVAHMNADIVSSAFAMESVALAAAALADREDVDIRLEAAAAKEWNTVAGWQVVDETLQVRGGRGYESEPSLALRGEPPIGVERLMRDARVNRIFEGSSEIMHLYMAREALDKHLQIAGALARPEASPSERLRALPTLLASYAWWYPSRWLGWWWWPRFRRYGALARHLRFVERASQRLARTLLHVIVVHRAGLEKRQALLFRLVDIACELFAMTASICRANALRRAFAPHASSAVELADIVARDGRRRVKQLFREVWHNDDARRYQLGRDLCRGRHLWLEQGIMGLPWTEQDLRPPTMAELTAARGAPMQPHDATLTSWPPPAPAPSAPRGAAPLQDESA